MSGFDMSFGGDAGWGGDTSFATDTGNRQDAETTKVAEKLPIPVPIVFLSQLNDEKIEYGTMAFACAQIIGDIVEVQNEQASRQYVLSDPTEPNAHFTVVTYDGLSDDEVPTETPALAIGTRVFAAGKLRAFNGEVTMVTYKVRPVEDPLEYQCFLKEVEIAKLYWEKGVPSLLRSGDGSFLTGCAAGAPVPKDGGESRMGGGFAAPSTSTPSRPAHASAAMGGGNMRDKILEALNKARLNAGDDDRKDMEVEQIATALRIPSNQIKVALEELSQEGLIYNTVDDSHYEAI